MKPGISAYAKRAWWVRSEFNWNQVCNSGLIIGTLAIAKSDPEYAKVIIPQAVQSLAKAIATYAPDGAWGEGPGYWNYATSYTVYGLAALDSALGTDFGLSEIEGLSEAGWFPIYTTGPTGLYFNFADVRENSRRGNIPGLFWLAKRFNIPALAEAEREQLHKRAGNPLDLIWYLPPRKEEPAPLPLDKYFGGMVEVAVFRSAWDDPQALFLAVKAGYNQVNHGQLDLGSFELDALGVRWARDLGSDDYNLPGYWQRSKKNVDRWSYYRLKSLSHNIPVLNNQDQDIFAVAKLTKFESIPAFACALVDLTSAYKDFARKVVRGVAMLDRRNVLVQDEFELEGTCEVAWGMTTDAYIQLDGNKAILKQAGKELQAQILSPAGAAFVVESAEQPPPQKSNKGVKRLMIRLEEQKDNVCLAVLLSPVWPEGKTTKPPELKALAKW